MSYDACAAVRWVCPRFTRAKQDLHLECGCDVLSSSSCGSRFRQRLPRHQLNYTVGDQFIVPIIAISGRNNGVACPLRTFARQEGLGGGA